MKYHCILIDNCHHVHGEAGHLTKLYCETLKEELDMAGVAFEEMHQKGPSTTDGALFLDGCDGKVALHLSMGKYTPEQFSHAKIRYSIPEGADLADKLAGVCSKWGKANMQMFVTQLEHDKTLPQHRLVIALEPYCYDSQATFCLGTKLDQLGTMLAKKLAEWMRWQNPELYRPKPALWDRKQVQDQTMKA